jgi:hypothetical protein
VKRSILALVLASALAPPGMAAAGSRGGGHPSSHSSSGHSKGSSHRSHASGSSHQSSSGSHPTTHSSPTAGYHTKSSTSGTHRTSHHKVKRDPEQRAKFIKTHPCPSTGKTHGACPGYVVDHVEALKRGGRDDPSNMQWQTKEAAKAKDKWE